MRFISTRTSEPVVLEQAIMSGTAPDGGLYVPETLPQLSVDTFAGLESFSEIATRFLEPFYDGTSLQVALPRLCGEALNFPVPLRRIEGDDTGLSVLEMFHGPTAAFKDVGARFLAANMVEILEQGTYASAPVTIIVATSGDTGAAVAAAFHRKPGTRVVVLFPDGRVSPRQQHQLTCWGDNVISLAVRGEFDDCQRMAKAAFADRAMTERHRLCSANSINVGRLLPQASYYAKASLEHFRQTGAASNFIVPTGNLGNGFACIWAKRMGLPIDRIVFATNANTTIADFLQSGDWAPRRSKATLASAMDVGDPSNMERLRALYGDDEQLRADIVAQAVDDDVIRATIADEYQRHGLAWCPHTATAMHVYRELPQAVREGGHWVVVSTAHAAKFDTIVEPLLDVEIEPPAELATLLDWPVRFDTIDPDLQEIERRL